jgi:hypothetical protein
MLKLSKYIFLIFLISFGKLNGQTFDFTAGISTSHFLGDLGGKPTLGTNDISDLDLLSTRYAITSGLRFNMGRVLALRTNLLYARVSGNDKYTINRERRGRNLSFFSSIYEADLLLESNVWRSQNNKKMLYVFGGVGYFRFNPKTRMDGQVYTLRDWGTEGQYSIPGKSPYNLSSICYPFGFGYKVNISKREYIGIELNTRKTRTDYIDDVSTYYVDRNLLITSKGPTAAALADRNVSDIPGFSNPGAIRGDSKNMDSYFFFSFTYNITIGNKGGNYSFGSGKRYRNRINGKRKCFEL